MGTARVPCHHAGLLAVPRWGPAGLARIACFRGGLRRPCLRRRRGHSAWPGAVHSSRGQPTRSGTGFPSPTASNVPARDDMSPAARSAPTHAGVPAMSGALAQTAPLTMPPATGTQPSPPPPASKRHKQAAPHLRCGAAGVAAPVQARCSQFVGESSPARPTPQPQRVVIGRPQLVGYFCPIPHPDDEEADCE